MTRSRRTLLVATLALALVLAACASVPTAPSIMALPGTGKSFADFQRDDETCRGSAEREIGASPAEAQTQGQRARGSLQHRYDMAYTQCMYANGDKVPLARAPSPRYAPLPPPPPQGEPPP